MEIKTKVNTKVITANLNGIRSAASKGFFEWLVTEEPDVVCVQETKIQDHQMSPDFIAPSGLHGHFHYAQKAGYSGVGVYTREKPSRVVIGFDGGEFDFEGRLVQVDLQKFTVLSAYFPSGSSSEERHAAKFRFLAVFLPHFQALQAECAAAGRGLLLCGDINMAHQNIDLKNWKGNLKNSGFTPDERAWMSALLTEHGMVDIWRTLHPEVPGYSWWSNRGGAYDKDVGWRIDYQLASADLAAKAHTASVYKAQKFSDHAPVVVEYGA